MLYSKTLSAVFGVLVACSCGVTSLAAGEPAPLGPSATSQPVGEAMPRHMMWDRAKDAIDAARKVQDMEQQLVRLRQLAERYPANAAYRRDADNAQHALEFLRSENAETLTRWKTGATTPPATPPAPKLEKASYLGVVTSPATPVLQKQLRLSQGMGLLVDYVEPGSPAEIAGLQAFDVVVKLNEQILVNAHQLAVLVRTFDPGSKVLLKVIREGKERSLEVTLIEREVKPLSSVVFGPTWTDARPVGAAQSTVPSSSSLLNRSRGGSRDAQIRRGDLVNLTLLDLEGPGLQTFSSSKVGKDGTIRAPYLRRPITAEGMSETTLQKSIADAYRAQAGHEISGVAVERIPPDDSIEVGG